MSRPTFNQFEAGKLKDLGVAKLLALLQVLGLDLALQKKQNQRGLFKVMVTANVSYLQTVAEEEVADALTSGKLPCELKLPVSAILDEAPLPTVMSAVKEAAARRGVPAKRV